MVKENSRIRFEFGEQSQSRRKRRGTSKGYQAGGEQAKRELRTAKEGWFRNCSSSGDFFRHLQGTKHSPGHCGWLLLFSRAPGFRLSLSPGVCPFEFMSFESVMPSKHLILCCPLLLLPSIFSSIRVFANESAVHIRCPKYWSFSWQTTQVFLPGEFHGQRSLADYSPWGHKELDTIAQLSTQA